MWMEADKGSADDLMAAVKYIRLSQTEKRVFELFIKTKLGPRLHAYEQNSAANKSGHQGDEPDS